MHHEIGGLIGYAEVQQGSLWVNRSDKELAQSLLNERPLEPEARTAWTCPTCGEVIDPQFDACWSCDTARGST